MVRSALAASAAIVDTERTSARVDSGQAARPAAVLTNTDDRGQSNRWSHPSIGALK